jgi:hypothetical protein
MKKTRLLEIIREEITLALDEVSNVIITNKKGESDTLPYNNSSDQAEVNKLKQDSNITSIKTTAGKKIKELASKYQIDEEILNEMASLKQLKGELEKQGKDKELEAIKATEKATLDTLKANPTITSDGRLKGYVSAFKKELQNTHGINLQVLLTKTSIGAEGKFNDDIATNTIEKDAANQLTGKEAGPRGPKADPNKPKAEPKTPGVRGRKPMGSKPKASTTDMDDEDKEAAKSAGSDKTAKELGKISSRKDKIVKDYKDLQPQVQDKIAKAKGGDKEAADWLKNTWTPILKAYNKAQQVKL